MAGFAAIARGLKETYQLLTLGGDAELECVDRFDPFAEGVEFAVRPPKKSWKAVPHLSGGEKTLASLALVFALHGYKPAPLYVMDEVDAALDFKNVAVVAQCVRRRTRGAQFVIVSLRHAMFEAAHRLVGVYKPRAASRCLALDPAALQHLAAEEEAAEMGK